MAIEHYGRHSQTGDDRAQGLHPRDGLGVAVDDGEEQHRKQRTGAHDERGVGGCGIEHRCILRQEINRTTRKTQ